MKLHYRLWITFTLLFTIVSILFSLFIIKIYEGKVLIDQEDLAISQGEIVVGKIKATKFIEQAEGYLTYYSERLNSRLLILDMDKQVVLDSFKQIPPQSTLSLTILQGQLTLPIVHFIPTTTFGYVQHTLMEVGTGRNDMYYLLMIRDVNFVYENIQSFRKQVMGMMIGAVIIFFFLCYLLAMGFTKPIRTIITKLHQISPQKRQFHMKYRWKDEIGELIQELSSMIAQLNGYDQRQRQFMSVSSHELKTPLATMQLIAENLPSVRHNKEEHQDFVDDLTGQIDKMKHIVQSMLEVNRMWDKPLQQRIITGMEIEEHIRKQLQMVADAKQITLTFTMNGLFLYGDPDLLLSGIENLVSNGIRYSPIGKEVTISMKKNADETLLSVCDHGIGISKAELENIFEPFYRSEEATAWEQAGSGLGLTIVKQMAMMHGARIDVKSELGEGTCITLGFHRSNR